MKIISPGSDNENSSPVIKAEEPHQVAERICDEIRRAIVSSTNSETQPSPDLVEEGEIISAAEAKKRTGYLEQLGHSIKRLVWA